jgi:recombinational DNA repair protein RecR
MEEEKKQKLERNVGMYSELVFECSVCKKIYKKPGICDICNVVLKPKGG